MVAGLPSFVLGTLATCWSHGISTCKSVHISNGEFKEEQRSALNSWQCKDLSSGGLKGSSS